MSTVSQKHTFSTSELIALDIAGIISNPKLQYKDDKVLCSLRLLGVLLQRF